MNQARTHMLQALLAKVPQDQRTEAVRQAITSISIQDASGAALALDLLAHSPDEEGRDDFLRRLQGMVAPGQVDAVLSVVGQDSGLQNALSRRIVERLHALAARLQGGPREHVALSMAGVLPLMSNDELVQDVAGGLEMPFEEVKSLLRFARETSSSDPSPSDMLIKAAITFLGASDQDVSMVARDTLLAAASFSGANPDVRLAFVWKCIQELITHGPNPFYVSLGYSIWLRFALSGNNSPSNWLGETYWHLLREGLQRGDGERRKQCLAILRRSVYAATNDKDLRLRLMVCPEHALRTSNESVLDNYERYCTVFETILLGRYLNQVLACEDDLDLLSSSTSLVKREWLYTLLASALNPKIQESNRKFIGNWIMRAAFRPDTSQDFLCFFREAFLPWAQQGSLFVSTLKYHNDSLHCDHGIRLAAYLQELLTGPGSDDLFRSSVIDTLLASIIGKGSGNFAYAAVYVLEGLGRAVDDTVFGLTEVQSKTIADLSSSPALPEVAREYLRVRCIRMLGQQRESKERIEPPSRRDLLEREAINKCHKLRKTLQDTRDATHVQDCLQDIFSDLEYLEYPKTLLMMMPDIIVSPGVVHVALNSLALAEDIRSYVQKLQKLSETRVYLMPPLVQALRTAVFSLPAAAELVLLADVIINYTESLPEPTIDMKLEESTIALLQSSELDTEPTFTYEHYFGDRRSVGIATFLDFTSRLGYNHATILQDVLDHIIQRWAKQRNPPPTVGSWKSTMQLQTMILAFEQLSPSWTAHQTEKYLKDLHYMLAIEPLPRYRYLLSWVLARLYLRTPELQEQILTELASKDHHSNPKYLASLMKIGVMLATAEGSQEHFASKLISTLVPLAASSKVIIRHEAQWQIPRLTDHARAKIWSGVTRSSAYMALDEYIRSLERFDDPPLERQLDRFDPVSDHNMTNLVEGKWFGLDTIERSTCSRTDFEVLLARDAKTALSLPASCIVLGGPVPVVRSAAPTTDGDAAAALPVHPAEALVPSKAGESRALQTKGTAYLSQDVDQAQRRHRNNIIVIASLVDNPYNLGGLSRVSEIFGASEVHLQNQNVTSNKDFSAVSVSSHLHFPILQLSASNVPTYLSEKRSEGWSVVGIEQTDRSVLLGGKECVLPERVVLVIGSEKEGIPALVLGECDLLVEIPQVGVTRSLNVQTAAGIVLFEYARQRRVKE